MSKAFLLFDDKCYMTRNEDICKIVFISILKRLTWIKKFYSFVRVTTTEADLRKCSSMLRQPDPLCTGGLILEELKRASTILDPSICRFSKSWKHWVFQWKPGSECLFN